MKPTAKQWEAIRDEWEYSPDKPSYAGAGKRAASKHQFKCPTRQSIFTRGKSENWERKGTPLSEVNRAANDRADKMSTVDHALAHTILTEKTDAQTDAEITKKETDYREESESKRAEIRTRHRKEWEQVASLRQQALAKRHTDPQAAFHDLKIGKITAEITAIQQAGEIRAWQLGVYISPERIRQMTDAELEALASGHPMH